MSSIADLSSEIKSNILKDYLDGFEVKDIAKKYGYKHLRTCYYHLQPLTREQRLQHARAKLNRLEGQ